MIKILSVDVALTSLQSLFLHLHYATLVSQINEEIGINIW